MRVAVVGATGLIGRRLAADLIARGDEVVALSRRGAAGIPGARDVRWDPARGPLPPGALDGCDAVVNLAGAPIGALRWTAARKRLISDSRTGTTRRVVDALAAPGAPRVLVNASAVGYYGPRGDEEVDERTPPGDDFLARACVAWEREALRARDHGARVVLVRTGIVLAREGGALPLLALPVRFLAAGAVGGGRQWVPWIHIDDESGLFRLALDRPDVEGPLVAAAPEPVRQREFAATLGRVLRRPAVIPAPALPLRLVMGEAATLALDGQRAIPRAALAAGHRFRHPGLGAALRALYS